MNEKSARRCRVLFFAEDGVGFGGKIPPHNLFFFPKLPLQPAFFVV